MDNKTARIIAYINPLALRDNIKSIINFSQNHSNSKPQSIIAMVKANAYGHGIDLIAPILESDPNIYALGVADLNEGLYLRRKLNISKPIIIFSGFFNQESIDLALKFNLDLVLHHFNQIQIIQNYLFKPKQKINIWLKINSGMNRLGLDINNLDIQNLDYIKIILNHPNINFKAFLSHFSTSDNPNSVAHHNQINILKSISKANHCFKLTKYPWSIENSGALILNFSELPFELKYSRPGLALYGYFNKISLKPVMSLYARVLSIQIINKNQSVGYGAAWSAKENDTPIAILGMGYGDGLPQNPPDTACIIYQNIKLNIIGKISMDSFAIDLSPLKNINNNKKLNFKWGELIELFGPNSCSAETFAENMGLSVYQLVSGLSHRVTRVLDLI